MGPVSASLSVFVLLGSAKGGEFNKKRAMEMGLGIVCLFFKSQILSLTSYQGVSNHDVSYCPYYHPTITFFPEKAMKARYC